MFFQKFNTLIPLAIGICLLFSFKEDTELNPPNGEKTSGANYFLNRGLMFIEKGKADSAFLCLKKAQQQYLASGNYRAVINCLYYLGCIEELRKDNISSLKYFTEANYSITKYKVVHPLQTDILYKIGKQYFTQDKFDPAYKATNQCLTLKVKAADSTLARIYHQKGIIEYYKGDYILAIASLQKSADIGSKAFGTNSLFVSDQINNLGVMNFMINKFDEALTYYEKSESILKSGHITSPIALAATYTNIGLIYRIKKDVENALLFYNKALDLSLPDPVGAKYNIASTYINISSVYRLQNDRSNEFDCLNKALSFSQKYYPVLLPKINQQFAIYYTEIKDFTKAEYYYEYAIRSARQLFSESPEIAYYYINYGQFQAERKNLPKSIEAFRKALPLCLKYFGKRNISTSSCLLNISSYFLDKNQPDSALHYIHEAIIANSTSFNNTDDLSLPDEDQSLLATQMIELLNVQVSILERLSNRSKETLTKDSYLKATWNAHQLALKILDNIHWGYINEDSRIFLFENEENTYTKALECALTLYEKSHLPDYLTQAFVITDKTHASSLQNAIKEKELPKSFKVRDSSLLQETQLKKDLSFYQELLLKEKYSKKPDSLKLKFWTQKKADLTFQLEKLLLQIKTNKPAWYQYKYRTVDNELLQQTQAKLKPNEILVEYFYTKSTLYSFCIDKANLRYHSSPLPPAFDEDLQAVLSFVGKPKVYISDSSSYLNYRKAAWNLYKLLLQPYESVSTGKNLIIIPFEKLTYIPFETLLTHETLNKSYNFKQLPYLIKQHTVRYLYAANLLAIEKRSNTNGMMAAFVPTYSSPDQENTLAQNKTRSTGLEMLPEASKEVESITPYFPGKIYTTTAASEDNFKKYASQYRTLHLAMHAVIDDNAPLNSRLVFTPKSSTNEDDLLYMYEISNLSLNADLVVLSACNTGVGKLQRGEGMMSLTRSFAFAGVPSIIMTLWSVNDNTSAQLMKCFYKNLASNTSKDVSLNNARLEYIENTDLIHAHPYYWAGYVLIGDNRPLKRPANTLWIIGVAVIILLSGAGFFIRNKKLSARK